MGFLRVWDALKGEGKNRIRKAKLVGASRTKYALVKYDDYSFFSVAIDCLLVSSAATTIPNIYNLALCRWITTELEELFSLSSSCQFAGRAVDRPIYVACGGGRSAQRSVELRCALMNRGAFFVPSYERSSREACVMLLCLGSCSSVRGEGRLPVEEHR